MAAKRRLRQAVAQPSRRNFSHDPGQDAQIGEFNGHRSVPISPSAIFLVMIIITGSFAIYWIHRSSPNPLSTSSPLHERDIVKSGADFRDILNENAKVMQNRSVRHFPNPVLAYVTPWNSKGYEVAKEFTSKFTHISPVWYELKSRGKRLFLDGRNNADKGWVFDLSTNGNALILPRVVLEAFPSDLLLEKKQRDKACDIILKECKEMEYDGIVLESWSRWAQYGILHDKEMRKMALKFIKQLGQAMHSVKSAKNVSHHLELIYAIHAPHSQNLADYDFGPLDLQELIDSVDGFSLMTYDFSGPQNPGPNAPLSWIHSSLRLLLGIDGEGGDLVHASMIFLGLNFYGNDFVLSEGSGGGALIGRDYLSLLEKHRPALHWDEKSAEHFFVYSHDDVQHAVFYPSLKSISLRLDEARAWQAGVSIWEIGQGLDSFYELL